MAVSTPAGDYKWPIMVQRESLVSEQDNLGHTPLSSGDDQWSEFLSTRARVMITGGREFQRSQQTHAELSSLLRIRFSNRASQITPEMRIQHKNGRKLNILSVFDVDDAGIEIEIACKELV